VIEAPETQYIKTDSGAHIAYQVCGDGPPDLVFERGIGSHVELAWEIDALARVLRRLASFSRLIRFDHQGMGMSDPLGRSDPRSLESRAGEMLAVLDAAGSERAALVANNFGGPVAILFAATYPNRTASLVLDGCFARLARAPDYPCGIPNEVLEQALARVRDAQLTGEAYDVSGLRYLAPHALQDAEFVAQWGRYSRYTASPSAAAAEAEVGVYTDVRALLPLVQAPTLVLYRRDDLFAGRPHAEYLASHIPGAKLVEVPGADNFIFAGDGDADLDEIEEFLTGARQSHVTDRVLATVLFTDIVASTERAAEVGDHRWRDLLDAHDRTVRRQLERFRGREINTVGDGFLVTFDGPGRGIECARAICETVGALGLEVRAGLHTGEIEVRGADVAGLAVHICARVAAAAGPGEVLVSGAVPPLVVGSGIVFADRGEYELRGVPGTWKLFAAVN
jgi:pimeloyl-ACP methyl ester carboxylesterase